MTINSDFRLGGMSEARPATDGENDAGRGDTETDAVGEAINCSIEGEYASDFEGSDEGLCRNLHTPSDTHTS